MSRGEMAQKLRGLIEKKDVQGIRRLFDSERVVDMAEPVSDLEVPQIIYLFRLLGRAPAAQLFTYMDEDRQQELITSLSGSELTNILEDVATDDMADVMGDLPANLTKRLLQAASPQTRRQLNMLLSYPDGSAGSIMSCDYFEFKLFDSVDVAIGKLKRQGATAETINTCYIIDAERKLVGSIELKDLLFESPKLLLKDIMRKDPVYVLTNDDQEKVASVMRRYDISIVPVVNDEERLIGIITADDVMDIMEEEVTEDIHKMNAVQPMEESYAQASVLSIVRSRMPWLLILMLTSTFNEMIIHSYEAAITAVPALIGFMPVVMDTAGNGGGQSSATVIRGIATGDVHPKDAGKVLRKELMVGFLCSVILFAIVYVRLRFFPGELIRESGSTSVALCVGFSICLSLVIGKVCGGLLPLLVQLLHLDPSSVASPIISTLADTTSLMIYFEMASVFFHLS